MPHGTVSRVAPNTHGAGQEGGAVRVARGVAEIGRVVSGEELAKRFSVAGGVHLVNDFVAAGYGLLTLKPHE